MVHPAILPLTPIWGVVGELELVALFVASFWQWVHMGLLHPASLNAKAPTIGFDSMPLARMCCLSSLRITAWALFRSRRGSIASKFDQIVPNCSVSRPIKNWCPLSVSKNLLKLNSFVQLQFRTVRLYCQESGEESTETDFTYALKCHISKDVNLLQEGLKIGLNSQRLKNSPALRRNAVYVEESCISGLPRYLTIHFLRFEWKGDSNQKILQRVDYPLEWDVSDLCSNELKQKLKAHREGSPSGSGESTMATSQAGIYDLVAVLTHIGREANSGHYIAWIKRRNGIWIKFDDEEHIVQQEEDILQLSGGGDSHMAYICLYKARVALM